MDTTIVLNLIYNILKYTAFIWAPVVLAIMSFRIWMKFINEDFLRSQKWVLLQIKVPKEVFKSPMAMELVLLNGYYQTGGYGNWVQKYWTGNLPMWASLEIASVEGNIYFYTKVPAKWRTIIESQFYAQYPQVEIVEADDYTKAVSPFDKNDQSNLWGCELAFNKPDAWPIKTYTDYGLDRAVGTLDEEQRIDPISSMLEFMGSLKKGQHFWFQILLRPSNWERFEVEEEKDGKKIKKKAKWKDVAKKELEAFREKFKPKVDGGQWKPMTRGEEMQVAALERSLGKLGFDSIVRLVYICEKDAFDPNLIAGVTSAVRQYNSEEHNSFKPIGNAKGFDFVWEDLHGNRLYEAKKFLYGDYVAREGFYGRFSFKKFHKWFKKYDTSPLMVLTTEEIATMYHFPGKVLETPTFKRIDSKRAEPPSNLPI